MSVDYDLVIIGSSLAGIQAAIAAASLKARVALVEQQVSPATPPESVRDRALIDLGHKFESLQRIQHLSLWQMASPGGAAVQWNGVQQWTGAIAANVEASRSLVALATLGIDVIPSSGEFCRKPFPGFTVDGRLLQARAYLITTGSRALVPAINGLQATGYLTPETVLQANLQTINRLVVIGGGVEAIAIAQALNRLGLRITVIVQGSHILTDADPEAAHLVQAQLEAEGIQILTHAEVSQVRSIQGKKWVQIGNQAIEADDILVAVGHSPNVESLNLDAVKVQWSCQGIPHNDKLQTTNPRIYACEGRIGNHCHAHVAAYEAGVATKNALFLPIFKATDRRIPRVVFSQPEIAWIGLTEPQAVQQHGKQVQILQRSFNTLTRAQIRSDLTGFCKLIVHRNGRLLGAHLVGAQSSEWVSAIAIAVQQNFKIQSLARLTLPSPTLSEIIQQTATDWQHLRLKQNHRLQDGLDWFFDLRRQLD
ncbi:MAG: NAD(P)/FAD-dependent oxidoreductase [Leptolyngbyaceae cyanobacterium RU_5_1]|nr:NAD(P)/FAD-dependent oxidoreductase [Leptolyngbyaceae cyanobacterium RU_5_1]